MEKDALERYLAHGLSLKQIGAIVGKDASTVGYWVVKHGLEANGRRKYSPKGGIDRDALEAFVEQGVSMNEMGRRLGLSFSTVRHWMAKYGLTATYYLRADGSSERPKHVERRCRRHGMTTFVRTGRAQRYRCKRCRAERVAARRRRVKEILVAEAGGRCGLCGYDRCTAALHFHHLDPGRKAFGLSRRGVTRSIAEARAEASKCVLLCSNCHAEVEAGLISATLVRPVSDPTLNTPSG
jgi:transposase